MEFSSQEYWSGFPFLKPGNLPHPGIKTMSLTFSELAGRFFSIFFSTSVTYEVQNQWEVKWRESCSVVWLFMTPWIYSPWNSPGQNTGVGSLSLPQGIFPTQGSNKGLLHCRRIPYQLNHKGSPTVLEWVAYSFSSRSSWPRNWTRVSCIAGGFSTNWTIMEAQNLWEQCLNLKQSFCTVRWAEVMPWQAA